MAWDYTHDFLEINRAQTATCESPFVLATGRPGYDFLMCACH